MATLAPSQAVPTVNLELYWEGEGNYSYRGYNIVNIDLTIPNSNESTTSFINTDLPPTTPQRLAFIKSKAFPQTNPPSIQLIESTDLLKYPMDLVGTIVLIANGIEYRAIEGSDSHGYHCCTTTFPLPVTRTFSTLQPDGTYQINVVNQGNRLRATLEEKAHDFATQRISQQERPETPISPFVDLESSGEYLPIPDFVQGFNAITTNPPVDPKLDQLNIAALQEELEEAYTILDKTRVELANVLPADDLSYLESLQATKQEIMQKVLALRNALAQKEAPYRRLSASI